MKKIEVAQMVKMAQAQETKEQKDAKIISMFCHIASVISGNSVNNESELNAIYESNSDVKIALAKIIHG